MADTTVTAQQVLLRVADEIGEVQSAFVDNVSSTEVRAAGISRGQGVNYQYALASIEGKGIRTVSTYYEADETLVVSSAFSPVVAAGDVISIYLWDANKRAKVQRAINQAIWASFPFWYREVLLDLNNSLLADGVTTWTLQELEAGTYQYGLPTDLITLSRIGLQTGAANAPIWYAPLANWRVSGQEGAFELNFRYQPVDFVAEHAGKSLCLHYAAREPQFSTFTSSDTTKLPLDYFSVAAAIYRRWEMSQDTALAAQWTQAEAMNALGRLGATKKHLLIGPKYDF